MRTLSRFQRIHKDRAKMARQKSRISQPLAVRRPRWIEGVRRIFVQIRVNLLGRSTFFDIHVPQIQSLVGERNLLTVRRPRRAIKIRWRISQPDLLHVTQSRLIHQMKRVFPGFVGKKRNPFSVWRPRWIALGNRCGPSQISDVALFRRDCQNFAASLEHGACSGR